MNRMVDVTPAELEEAVVFNGSFSTATYEDGEWFGKIDGKECLVKDGNNYLIWQEIKGVTHWESTMKLRERML